MSQSVTYPNKLLLGVDNVRRKLDLPILGESNQAEHWIWRTLHQVALLTTIIEGWFQQNIPPRNSSVDLNQKGSFTAGFGPTA